MATSRVVPMKMTQMKVTQVRGSSIPAFQDRLAETYPLEKAAEAYARMLSGKAEFRVVSTM